MVESNVTRRRVLQGAGAISVASLGSTVISAQEGDGGGGDQGAAIRVAHASPDAPNVDVRLTSQDGGGEAAGGANETGGDANETGDGQDGGGGQGGDADTEIGGVGFRDVSGYNEIDPGSYQVQIVPAEGGLLEGFVDDLFGGGGEDEETVLFEDQIDVEEGTTYTVVAFGEVAQGPVPAEGAEMDDGGAAGQNETDGGMGGNETGGAGQNETDGAGMDVNESDGGVAGQNETGGAGQNETDGAGAGGAAGQDDQLISELGFGESQSVEVDPGDYSLEVREAGAAGATGGADDGMAGNETGADAGQNETEGVGTDGNETDGGMAGQNETGGVGANESDGTGAGDTAGQTGGADRGFQVQVLEDDVSDPGEETARVRVFHAVPDVDTVSVVRISEGGIAQGGDGGNETGGAGGAGNDTDGIGGDEGAGQEEGEGGAGGDGAGQDDGVGAGQEDGGAGQQENETVATNGNVQQQEGVRRAQLSTDANTVYSGFAVGYFDPQAAASAGQDGGDGGAAGNDTDGMGGDGAGQNESDDGIGAGQQDDNATGNETGGDGEQIAEDAEGEEFELLTVEDAQGGERSDGGTGGLLNLAAVADD